MSHGLSFLTIGMSGFLYCLGEVRGMIKVLVLSQSKVLEQWWWVVARWGKRATCVFTLHYLSTIQQIKATGSTVLFSGRSTVITPQTHLHLCACLFHFRNPSLSLSFHKDQSHLQSSLSAASVIKLSGICHVIAAMADSPPHMEWRQP